MSLPNQVEQGKAGGPYEAVKSSNLLAYWPFFGTYFDVSPYERGCALAIGDNVQLAWDQNKGYVKIRKPGFLNIPAVDVRTISFSIEMTLRIPSTPTISQVLLTNWQDQNWQYLMFIETNGTLVFTLRANTKAPAPPQDLAIVQTKVPIGKWFNAVYVYDTSQRTFSVSIDGVAAGSAVVKLPDLTLHTAPQKFIQFGNKGDDVPVTGNVDADLTQLRFYELTF